MKPSAIAIAFFLGVAAIAQQPAEPYHIKDDVLGELLTDYRLANANPLPPFGGIVTNSGYHPTIDCTLAKDASGLRDEGNGVSTCITPGPDETYAGLPMRSKSVSFYENRLYLVRYAFSRNSFPAIAQAISVKFGPASSEIKRDVEGGFGTKVQRDVMIWRNGVSTITLTESSVDDLETSVLEFSHDGLHTSVDRKREHSTTELRKSDM